MQQLVLGNFAYPLGLLSQPLAFLVELPADDAGVFRIVGQVPLSELGRLYKRFFRLLLVKSRYSK
jgi:hypothetical protein